MTEFEEWSCIKCFMPYRLPKGFEAARREDSNTFWCPGCGNRLHFPKGGTEADRLRRELERAKQNEAYLNDQIKHANAGAEHEYRRRVALSGQVTKLKNRAQAGVCPCCNRTFKQLQAHMAQKHPAFKAEPAADSNVPMRASP